jgi:hypothetical protein
MRLITHNLAAAAVCAALLPAAARADDPAPPPDKSGYDLFNPTPDTDLRGFSTDRPDKSATAYTVDAGHFQYETDLLGILYDGYANTHTTTRQFFTADPVLKLGVTNYADVEVALGGYLNQHVMDRSAGTSHDTDGFGDVTLRAKFNLFGNDGGPAALSVAPFFKLPTATRGLGNRVGEFGVVAPAAVNLPFDVTLLLVTEFDDFKNASNTGRHAGFTNSIALERPITPQLTIEVELWAQVQSSGVPAQYTFDVSLAYLLGPNTKFDMAAYAGLNKAAPDIVGYVGLSQRF